MATTTHYCTRQDVIDRLTTAGVLRAADPTGHGTVSDPAVLAAVDRGLDEAGRKIDLALQPTWQASLPVAQDDASLNTYLRGWAIKIACWHVATNGGKGIPQQVKDEYKEATDELKRLVDKGGRVPGLVYPGDGYLHLRYGMGRPRVANPGEAMTPGSIGDRNVYRRRGWG